MAFAWLKNLMGPKVPEVGAIDMGSSMIKICQIGGTLAAPQVYRFATCPTPPMTVKDGSIVGSQALGDAVKSLLTTNGITCKKMITSVFGQQVVIRPIV